MRIAVDFRFLAGGPNVVNRGTGRYTQHQLNEVLKLDRENEYLLVCHNDDDLSLVLPEIRAARNLVVARIPFAGYHVYEYPNHTDRALRNIAQLQEWLYRQRVDIYHETTPYQIDELVLHQFDACPLVATLYDMIPMVFPQHYWPPGSAYHNEIGRAFQLVRRADRLIAISQSASYDVQTFLGISQERIDLAYPFADPMFRVLPSSRVEADLRGLRARLGIPSLFLMSLTHMHHSKNIETLFAAYGKLPVALRKQVPLVIVFFLRDVDKELMSMYTARYGITDNVIFTGLISDDELVALYNAATIVVHPSRYEGFGLPVVEAMSCGAPVITTTASSLPEVGGDAAMLIDPDDAQGFADAIDALLADAPRRETMRAQSLEQVKKFNPEQLGRNTLACYHKTQVQVAHQLADERPRIAVYTSLPPLKCGIADYTVELLGELRHSCNLEIFVDDGYLPTKELIYDYSILHHSAFERRQEQQPFDTIIYQMGVSTMHDFMYAPMRKYPGIVAIHDLIFAQGLHYVHTVRNRLDEFRRDIVAAEGTQALRQYDQALRLRGTEQEQALRALFERYLMLGWVVNNSLAQVVHMELSRKELLSHYPQARPYTVDMGVADPWRGITPLRTSLVRAQLGLPRTSFIVGVFGSIAPIKRIESCILAFYHLQQQHDDAMLLIVGEPAGTAELEYDQRMRELVQHLGIAHKVSFTGRIARQYFDRYMLASDVVLNLRYPPRQQMSAVLIRAIAAGKPVVVTDIPEWRYLPESFCKPVAANEDEVPLIADYLRCLANDPALLHQASQAARLFFEQRGTVRHAAAQYSSIIDQLVSQMVDVKP